MAPITSPDNTSPVKKSNKSSQVCKSDEENYNVRYNSSTIKTLVYGYYQDTLYRQDFIKMDGTYDNNKNIQKPLRFPYGADATIKVTMNVVRPLEISL